MKDRYGNELTISDYVYHYEFEVFGIIIDIIPDTTYENGVTITPYMIVNELNYWPRPGSRWSSRWSPGNVRKATRDEILIKKLSE